MVRRAREQGLSLTGPDGLLKKLTTTVLETALNQEMTEHLGHEERPDRRDVLTEQPETPLLRQTLTPAPPQNILI